MRKKEYWIQQAIHDPDRVRRYMRRTYGAKAFTGKGKIRIPYLDKAIAAVRKNPRKNRNYLLYALLLAKKLKNW